MDEVGCSITFAQVPSERAYSYVWPTGDWWLQVGGEVGKLG